MYAGNVTGGGGTRGFRVVIIDSMALGTGETGVSFGYLGDLAYYSSHTINSWPSEIVTHMRGRGEDRTYDWFRDFEHRKKPPLYLKNPPLLRGIRRIAKGPNKVQQYRAKRRKLIHLMRST